MPASLRKHVGRFPVDTQPRPSAVGAAAGHATPSESGNDGTSYAGASNLRQAPFAQAHGGRGDAAAAPSPSPGPPPSSSCDDGMGSTLPSVAIAKHPGFAPSRPPSTPQATVAARLAGAARGGGSGGSGSGPSDNVVAPSMGSGFCKLSLAAGGRSPNTRLRQPFGGGAAGQIPSPSLQQQGASGTSPPLHRSGPDATIVSPTLTSATAVGGSTGNSGAASPTGPFSPLASTMSVSGLSNHLRLSEGLSCLDYHTSFRALAIGSTRQIHVVEVIPIVGHDVGAALRLHRQRQQQQTQEGTNAVTPSGSRHSNASLSTAAPPTLPGSPPSPLGSAPFLMRNTGVFGGLNKVESVAWYPSNEEASLAFIQPARTVTIFLDAIQFKADGTYLPQQWTRSQYKGKTLTSAMAAGSGSTAMAVVANLDCVSGGVTPAISTASLGGGSGLYTPVSASLASVHSFGGASASHGSTPHETNLSTPTSAGYSTTGSANKGLPHVVRNPKGPLAKELIELNIDITYMRVEKIVWDPHHPYTLALSSPATHFEVWQVPTDDWRVYAPQLVLRPPAHNTRSVVRDLAFSPSEPDLIVVVTECGNTGQVLLYDRRQVEAKRCFDISGPGLSAAFHPLFSDLLAVCFRREKAKPDTRISFLRVISSRGAAALATADSATAAAAWLSEVSPAAAVSSGREEGPLAALSIAASGTTGTEYADGRFATNAAPASTSSYLTEQPYLPHIDNYACVSRMRWRPSSMGRLVEPKRHHYLSFKPSAEALIAARNSPNPTVPSAAGAFTWMDLLHSQLWFASAAMTTDTDLSIWDAANGFFPVCVVKHLTPRGDTTANESNDFVWLNELTLVAVFKSGDVVCSSFVSSLLEDSIMTSAERVQLREATPQQQEQLQWQRQQFGPNARDELGELYSKRIAEEESCLAMLPAYVRDPYADLFTTFTVLPTASIVSDLFGHSYAIRNTNAALRRSYHLMIRRECGQLVRRLAIQVSKEAVLRQQWTKMRHQLLGAGPSTGPGMASGLAALQEQRSRRPRSPFMQTGGLCGRAGSSQGSYSTPPSPQYRVLARRYLTASSPLSVVVRHMSVMPILGSSPSGGTAGPREAGGGGGSVADALLLPQHSPWSLEDVSEAGTASSRLAREPRRHVTNAGSGDSVSGDSHHQHLSAHRDGGMADLLMEDAAARGHVSSRCPEVANAEEAAGAVDPFGRSSSRASSAVEWIGRLLGFSWRKRPSCHRASDFRELSIDRPQGFLQAEALATTSTSCYDGSTVLADVHDVAPDVRAVPSPNVVSAAASPQSRPRQTPPCGVGFGGGAKLLTGFGVARSTATSPISVMHIENSDSSLGSPHQLAPAASAAHVRVATAHSFPAYPRTSPSPTAAVNPAFSPQQPCVGSGRGAPSPSSSLHMNSSVGPLSLAPGDFDIVGGGSGDGGNAAVTASGGMVSYCRTRSGVVFTQLFPLMTECVRVRGGSVGEGSCKVHRQCGCSEGRQVASLYIRNAMVSAPMAKTAPSSAPAIPGSPPTSPAVAAVRQHLPTVLSSPVSHSDNTVAEPEVAIAPSLLLPFLMADPVGSGASGGAAVASPHMSTHAYLDSQRDVTAAVENFVLSDAACGWSYTEKQVEQVAFVRFALEWDMGYELALAMKALRHKRTDAEAAAEALVEADGAASYSAGLMPGMQPSGPARSQSALREASARDADISSAPQRSRWRSSSSRGARQYFEWNAQQQMKREPCRSRPGGACGASHMPFCAPSADSTRMVDWGCGVPIPRHEDVDDKVAAMMEENARICERVLLQRWETAGADSAGCCAEANRCRSQGEGDSVVGVSGGTVRPAENAADNGELSCPASAITAELTSAAPCDPRAQWWRAAAHAWRSHHISFIISITAQQLEYAALMGDVQYSLVLYILFCLWWRLHSEVAEAAYATALEARACLPRVGGGVDRDGGAGGGGDGGPSGALQEITSHNDTGHNRRARPTALAPGKASEGERSNGGGGLGVSGASADTDRDNSSRRMRTGLRCRRSSSSVKSIDGDETATDRKTPSSETVEALRQLCLFFLRCPLMPLSSDSASRHLRQPSHPHLRPSASTGAFSCVTGSGAEPGDHAGAASSPLACSSSLSMPASGVGGPRLVGGSCVPGSLGSGVFLRSSASTQSLPPRSYNNSPQRLDDTLPPPAMIDSVGDNRFACSDRANTSRLASLGDGAAGIASYRERSTSPTPQTLQRPDSSANSSRAGLGPGATTCGTTLESRDVYVDLEGLRGVRLYSRSANDLCTTQDYCAPEEWKIRALQWLETYTADLYARQLYVPLNELLLVMPEIFREPTNPVLPRAADIAYEKQMTYVYCGACSKAELWSRTHKETVPAAVRLYELVVRRGRHSISSEEEGDESDSKSGATAATGADARRSHRKGRAEYHLATSAIRCGSVECYRGDGEDSSSVLTTLSVESPTSSNLSGGADDDDAGAKLADGTSAAHAGLDVSLSLDSCTDALHEVAALEGAVAVPKLKRSDSSTCTSATGSLHVDAGATAGHVARPSPEALSSQRRQSASASHPPLRRQHSRRIKLLRSSHSRRSLDGTVEAAPNTERDGDNADDGDEVHIAGAVVNAAHRPQRHTAVGCDECDGNPTPNNATCRRCHNRSAMTCVICEEVVEGIFFWLRSCGHGGHVHHIEEWLRYSQECPKCGISITQTWKDN